MSDAGLYTSRGIGDLSAMITSLAEQGFRIIAVIDTHNGDYHVVAQKDSNDRSEAYSKAKARIQERVDHLRTHGHTHVQAVLQGTLEAILKDMP